MTERRIVVISDLQVPYQDQPAVENVLRFVSEFEPDMLVNVGDDIDSPQTSHWHKGRAGEYAGTLQRDIDATRQLHTRFCLAIGNVPYHVSRSNHGDRTQKYINQYAPALASLSCLQLEKLLGYDALGIEFHREPFEIAPGWVCAHGDEGTVSPIAGRTASLLAEKWGVSIVCGHTHRAGVISKSYGYGGQITGQVTGMEVGHLMDVKQAGYLAGGHADWQQAFGVLYVNGDKVRPDLVPIQGDGSFIVEGVSYGERARTLIGDGFATGLDVFASRGNTEDS